MGAEGLEPPDLTDVNRVAMPTNRRLHNQDLRATSCSLPTRRPLNPVIGSPCGSNTIEFPAQLIGEAAPTPRSFK